MVKTGSVRDLYRSYGLENGELGYPISNEKGGLKGGASYQLFEKAVVYSHPTLGTYVVLDGATRDLYRKNGLENGEFGYPISNEQNGLQRFENRVVVNGVLLTNGIYEGYASGQFGGLMRDVQCGLKSGGCYQVFEDGIVYEYSRGVFIVKIGKILDKFRQANRENGIGYPIANERNGQQQFENGVIDNT